MVPPRAADDHVVAGAAVGGEAHRRQVRAGGVAHDPGEQVAGVDDVVVDGLVLTGVHLAADGDEDPGPVGQVEEADRPPPRRGPVSLQPAQLRRLHLRRHDVADRGQRGTAGRRDVRGTHALGGEPGEGRLEVVIAIANWSMFAQLLRSLEVPLEEGVDPWPPDGAVPEPARTPVPHAPSSTAARWCRSPRWG